MIDYDDNQHRYSHKGVRYLSSTQIVEMFKQPFDTEYRAQKKAERYGGEADDWKGKWKEINLESLDRGQGFHVLKQSVLEDRMLDVRKGKVFPVPNRNLLRNVPNYMMWPDGVHAELMLWNHKWRIAGRADKVTFDTVRGRRTAHVDDYKTNKVIRTSSYYNTETGKYQMLLYPLDYLMDCTYITHSLQLSLYMFMLEEMGFEPGEVTMIHQGRAAQNAPKGARDPKPIPYLLKYMRKEVLLMLNHLRRA